MSSSTAPHSAETVRGVVWVAPAVRAFVAVAAVVLAGCAGPALTVSLQVQKGDPAIDTSTVTSLEITARDLDQGQPEVFRIAVDEGSQNDLAVLAPPAGDMVFIVVACDTAVPTSCVRDQGLFVGCAVEQGLAPSEETRVVFVNLFPIDPVPASCSAFVASG